MSISGPFIRRPVATSLVAVAFLLLGLIGYINLPVAALPQVDFPTIQVSVALPGASPETMASNVATPLERQFALIQGLTQMTSVSSLGSSSITLQFDLSRNIDAAAEDVQAAINAAGGQLPTNLPAPPTFRKINPADAPIMIISMSSNTLPIQTVNDYADNILSQHLSQIEGIGQVVVGGQQKPAIRIRIDPHKMAALGLQLDNIRAAVANQTINAPKGSLNGTARSLTVYANDQIMDPKIWNNLVVGYNRVNGGAIRISDLGGAVASVENDQIGAWSYSGKAAPKAWGAGGKAVLLIIFKSPGANVIKTVDAIGKALPGLRANIPPGIDVRVVADRTQTIRASVRDVEITLLITVFLVVGVIFLFLQNLRATIIPSVVIPLALLATAAIMLAANFSIDNLSLMALTIAVGFVVDDAIVMEEVIWQRVEHGMDPFEAALKGAGEINFTILSISISLVAVFTPLVFMGGVVGRLMREFALTLSGAVVLSIFLSLTVTPMMCSRFLKPPSPPRDPFTRALADGFRRLESGYVRWLDFVLRHMRITLGVFIATIGLAIFLYATTPTGFFPEQDTGFMGGVMLINQAASFEELDRKVSEVAKVICSDPAVEWAGFFAGNGGSNQANLSITLKPQDQGRKANVIQVINRLRPRLAKIVGAQTFLQPREDINVGGRLGQAEYQYTLSDADLAELDTWAPRLLSALQKVPELKDVNSDQESQGGAVNLTIDRNAAARFGIMPADIDNAIYNLIGQREVTQYFTQLNAYHVIIEAPPLMQGSTDIFNTVSILSPVTGKTVPLSLFVKVDPNTVGSLTVSHQGQFPAATISFNLAPGVSLGQATQLVQKARDELGAPATLTGSFQGTAQAFQQSLSSEPLLILAALIAVYVILGILYESYIHPLTILSTLPSAGVGALLALRLAGEDLNVIGIIAIILLIGIVKKNGIMIVDVALRLEREHGFTAMEAARQASHQRLRPILMTTAAAMLGGVPMILFKGTGSEFRQPLGYAIVGGLLVSQVLTLFTTPVIYIYLDRLRGGRRGPEGSASTALVPSGGHPVVPYQAPGEEPA
ncbi:MAG TPA: efflux RND transporter permease subunit [Caulobacteraceae bacterium]|nr:efflux RND transporter permease subunit [Caulobacteraceae bacterium]